MKKVVMNCFTNITFDFKILPITLMVILDKKNNFIQCFLVKLSKLFAFSDLGIKWYKSR